MEARRKALMSQTYDWGDSSPSQHSRPFTLNLNSDKDIPTPAKHAEALIQPSQGDPKLLLAITTKGWTLENLLSRSPKFFPVQRINALSKNPLELQNKIQEYENSGIPLVIEGWHEDERWSTNFNPEYFRTHLQSDTINVRNIHTYTDSEMGVSALMETCRKTTAFAEPGEKERFYGKDAPRPDEWKKWLCEGGAIPSLVLLGGPTDYFRYRPTDGDVETLMCYVGIGDTFTPCHKDLCASSGQNLMCYTENGGSSFWFMTESSSAPQVVDYFHTLDQELDHENHVITVEQLADAPFNVYITEQKLGDLVLVPPRSCHQVVNYGGITIKSSWSRMTLNGLITAYYHELPIYRRVCRPEIYRVKSTIHHAIVAQTAELNQLGRPPLYTLASRSASITTTRENTPATITYPVSSTRHEPLPLYPDEEVRQKSLCNSLSALLKVYDEILVEEYSQPEPEKVLTSSFDNSLSCDFCGADIFQSYFESLSCKDSCDDGYIICAGCYVEGRSCKCGKMVPKQCRPFEDLLQDRERAINALKSIVTRINVQEQSILLNRPGIFQAANYVLTTKISKDTRSCVLKGRYGSHTVPYARALFCKKCHSGRCFEHLLLDQYLHSAEALIAYHSDIKHATKYHTTHQTSKHEFESGIQALVQSQMQGNQPPNPHLLRVQCALQHSLCKPISPAFSLGWYDRVDPISNEDSLRIKIKVRSTPHIPDFSSQGGEIETEIPSDPDLILREVSGMEAEMGSAFNSPLTTLPSTPTSEHMALPDLEDPIARVGEMILESLNLNVSTRKRKLTCYVLVPSAPYPISQLKSKQKEPPPATSGSKVTKTRTNIAAANTSSRLTKKNPSPKKVQHGLTSVNGVKASGSAIPRSTMLWENLNTGRDLEISEQATNHSSKMSTKTSKALSIHAKAKGEKLLKRKFTEKPASRSPSPSRAPRNVRRRHTPGNSNALVDALNKAGSENDKMHSEDEPPMPKPQKRRSQAQKQLNTTNDRFAPTYVSRSRDTQVPAAGSTKNLHTRKRDRPLSPSHSDDDVQHYSNRVLAGPSQRRDAHMKMIQEQNRIMKAEIASLKNGLGQNLVHAMVKGVREVIQEISRSSDSYVPYNTPSNHTERGVYRPGRGYYQSYTHTSHEISTNRNSFSIQHRKRPTHHYTHSYGRNNYKYHRPSRSQQPRKLERLSWNRTDDLNGQSSQDQAGPLFGHPDSNILALPKTANNASDATSSDRHSEIPFQGKKVNNLMPVDVNNLMPVDVDDSVASDEVMEADNKVNSLSQDWEEEYEQPEETHSDRSIPELPSRIITDSTLEACAQDPKLTLNPWR